MSCDWVEDRLFDEDCREALAGRTATPIDVTRHLEACAPCREVWALAREEGSLLREGLLEEPPASLRLAVRSLRPATSRRARSRGGRGVTVDWELLAWGLVGGAVTAGVAATAPLRLPDLQWLAFAGGLVVTSTLGALVRLGWGWRRLPTVR